jgi:hypothetical protein
MFFPELETDHGKDHSQFRALHVVLTPFNAATCISSKYRKNKFSFAHYVRYDPPEPRCSAYQNRTAK